MFSKPNLKNIEMKVIAYFLILFLTISLITFLVSFLIFNSASKNERIDYYTAVVDSIKNELDKLVEDYLILSTMSAYKLINISPEKNGIEQIISNFSDNSRLKDLHGIILTNDKNETAWHYRKIKTQFSLPYSIKQERKADLRFINNEYFLTVNIPVNSADNKQTHVFFYFSPSELLSKLPVIKNHDYIYLVYFDYMRINPQLYGNYHDSISIFKEINREHLDYDYYVSKEKMYFFDRLTHTDIYIMLITEKTGKEYYYYFIVLFTAAALFIFAGIIGIIKILKPLDEVVSEHFQNFNSIIDEKSAVIEKFYGEFLNEREKNLKYMNIAGVILLSLDHLNRVKMINSKGCKVLGYTESEILGKNWFDNFSPEEDIEKMKMIIAELRENRREGYIKSYEGFIINNKGERRVVNWSIVYLESGSHDSSEVLFSGEDVTDQKRLEEEYRQSQKMESIGRLAGGIAHDFNNLLTIIIGNTDILISETEKDTQLSKDLDSINKAANRAALLTDQLLAFSRKQVLKPQILNINHSINNMTKMIARLIGKNINIETYLSDDIYKIKADKGQFEQILLNLSVNARDAMPNGGKIIITTKNIHIDSYYCRYSRDSRPGHFVLISFSDTGTGISEEIQKNIFEPFFTTKEPGKGTGLGLSVVYGIVKQHEGWINVRSREGEGTTFNIYLPILLEDIEESININEDIDKYLGNGETIFFVEDEEDIRVTMSSILSKKGYSVITASSYKEGLEIFDKNSRKIDIIITDIVLTDDNGINLIKKIEKKLKNTKVIFTSGYVGDSEELNKMLEKGYKFIQKPYSIIELFKLIKENIK